MMADERKETLLATRTEFAGRRLSVRTDLVRTPDGRDVTREVVEPGDAVCVVPVDEDGRVLLVEQYRHPVRETLLEVCAGGMHPGEDPLKAALREMAEETGHRARDLRLLATFWLAPGYSTERMYAYLATGLEETPGQQDDDEAITTRWVPLKEVPSLIERGDLRDSKSIVSLLLALSSWGSAT